MRPRLWGALERTLLERRLPPDGGFPQRISAGRRRCGRWGRLDPLPKVDPQYLCALDANCASHMCGDDMVEEAKSSAALHFVVAGTSLPFQDVRVSVAIGGKADLSR